MKNFMKIMLALVIAGSGLTLQGLDPDAHALAIMPEQEVVAQAVEAALNDKAIESALKKLVGQNSHQQGLDTLRNQIAIQAIQTNEVMLKALESIAKKFEPKKEKDPTALSVINDYIFSPVWKTVLKPFCPIVKACVVIAITSIVMAEILPGGYDAAQATRLALYIPYVMAEEGMKIAYSGFGESVPVDAKQLFADGIKFGGMSLLRTFIPERALDFLTNLT